MRTTTVPMLALVHRWRGPRGVKKGHGGGGRGDGVYEGFGGRGSE